VVKLREELGLNLTLPSPLPLTLTLLDPNLTPTHRAQQNDAAVEVVKLREELGLLRVQLDAARKEAEAQHKRSAAIEVSLLLGGPAVCAVHGGAWGPAVHAVLARLVTGGCCTCCQRGLHVPAAPRPDQP